MQIIIFLIHYLLVIITHTAAQNNTSTLSTTPTQSTRSESTTPETPHRRSIPNPEIENPDLLNWFKFIVRGTINEHFIADLENIESETFKTATTRLNNEFERLFSEQGLIASYVLDFMEIASNATMYNAALYFNTSYHINATKIQDDVNRERSSVLGTVVTTEMCAKYTCSSTKDGTCTYDGGVAKCSCKIGFRGVRCENAYTVNGTVYSPWSNWTPCTKSCEIGKKKKLRWCKPKPVNGGVCVIGPYEQTVNRSCNVERCPREHDDDDYYIIAYICGGLLLAIIILLIGFCCTHQYTAYVKSNVSKVEKYSPRTNQPIVKRASNSYSFHSPYIQNKNIVPLHKLPPTPPETSPRDSGFDNFAFGDQVNMSESEKVYKLQLQKFLEQAPGIRHNVLSSNECYDSEGSLVSPIAIVSPIRREKRKPTPAARPQPIDMNDKIIERGPSRYQLVMI